MPGDARHLSDGAAGSTPAQVAHVDVHDVGCGVEVVAPHVVEELLAGRGSVQIVQGRRSRLDRTTVNGDVQYVENRGAISITRNRNGGNLQCKENSRRPTGGRNVVQGNKEDQCARL